jgi:RNA polymerase sigma-70 factor (ECF subfamily)
VAGGVPHRRRGAEAAAGLFPGAGGPGGANGAAPVHVVGLDSVAGDVVDRSVDPDLPATTIDLVRALHELTEQQRACVVLRDVAGMTAPEAAAVLGTTTGTVRVQSMRGRRRLRDLLEDDDA